jgi:hypothetical protein
MGIPVTPSDLEHVFSKESLEVGSANDGRVTKIDRSDTAYAAGFVALASIFSRFSLTPLIWQLFRLWQHEPGIFDLNRREEATAAFLFTLAIPLPGLLAPVALWLGIKACSDLKRNPYKAGALQAGFALLIGFLGTLILMSEIAQVTASLLLNDYS